MTVASADTERRPALLKYTPAPTATDDLDYVDLATIDLSKLETESGKVELIADVRDAMKSRGFLYVVNHGLTLQQTEHIFDIANFTFNGVTDEDKQKYAGNIAESGSFQGYKARQYWHIDSGVLDQIETFNINRDVYKRDHPEELRPFLSDIRELARHTHLNVVHTILKLLALGMGLAEETFTQLHGFDAVGETYVRFMKYHPRSEEETKTKNVWLKGHTDIGSITVLYSQPVAALQILSLEGKWRWIKHIPGALVVNVGDALEYLSGGFYRATIHRVVQPPPSQRGYTRLGVYYFALPDDNVKLVPYRDPITIDPAWREGKFQSQDAPTMEVYRKGRTAAYGRSTLQQADDGEGKVEEELISGVVVRHYN